MAIQNFPDFRMDVLRFELDPNTDLKAYVSEEAIKKTAKDGFFSGLSGMVSTFVWECVSLIIDPARSLFEIFSRQVFLLVASEGVGNGVVTSFFGAVASAAEHGCKVWEYNNDVMKNWKRASKPSMESADKVINAFLKDRTFITEEASSEVCCSVSRTFMLRPMQLPCNAEHILDEKSIEERSSAGNNTCPLCEREIDADHARYSELTFMKSCVIIRRIARSLLESKAPEGTDIVSAKRVIQDLGQRINEYNDVIFIHTFQYLRRYRADKFSALFQELCYWQDNVKIPEIPVCG